MTDITISHPGVHIVVVPTGGGHFNAHISLATIAGNKFVCLNDGTAKQLYEALREIFGSEDQLKIADLTSLAYQYSDDLRHPPERDSVKRRLERIDRVLNKKG